MRIPIRVKKTVYFERSWTHTGFDVIALAFHYAQLEASAFREEYDPSTFDDPTKPKLDMIHKVHIPI